MPFSDKVYDVKSFDYKTKNEMNTFVKSLRMEGGTAMYDGVGYALAQLEQDKRINGDKYRYSVIVLTDGVSNQGADFNQFKQWFMKNGLDDKDMRVFAISFGEADMNQLKALTELTKGKVFDGKTSLSAAFREIRSYQ